MGFERATSGFHTALPCDTFSQDNNDSADDYASQGTKKKKTPTLVLKNLFPNFFLDFYGTYEFLFIPSHLSRLVPRSKNSMGNFNFHLKICSKVDLVEKKISKGKYSN